MAGMNNHTVRADFKDEASRAMEKLLQNLGSEKIILLSDELEKLVNDPGYGEINIRVHDHRMLVIQVTKTFK